MSNKTLTHEVYNNSSLKGVKFGEGFAKSISMIMSPPLITILGIFISANPTGGKPNWWWAVFCIIMSIAPPLLYVLWLMVNEKVSNFHLDHRHQRIGPALAMTLSTVVLLACLISMEAPASIIAFCVSSLVLITVMFFITTHWKISTHCAATGALFALLFAFFGLKTMFIISPVVPLVAWARIHLGCHNVSQTVAGSLIGAVIFALTVGLFFEL